MFYWHRSFQGNIITRLRFLLALLFLVAKSFFFQKSFKLEAFISPLVATIMAKSEQILWERFENILKQSFKGHKHAIDIISLNLKKMMRSVNAGSSDSDLIPSETL